MFAHCFNSKNLFPDANAGSSGGGTSSLPQDAKELQATTKLEESSPSADAKNEKTYDELAMDSVIEKHVSEDEEVKPLTGESSTPETGQEEDKNVDSSSSSEIKKSNETEKKEDSEDFSKLPFHEHPDFKKLVQSRNETREVVKQLAPYVERQKSIETFCQDNGITPQEFRDSLEIAALIKSNPQEALKRLQPTLEQLSVYQGLRLPKDLQEKVDDGTIPLDVAQRIAKAEANQSFVQQRQQVSSQQQAQQMVATALTSWEEGMLKSDPDYAKKMPLVNKTFVALSAMEPWQTPEQAVALARKALNEVNATLSGFIPKRAATKTISSDRSTVSSPPKNGVFKWEDAEDAMVQRYSHGFPKK